MSEMTKATDMQNPHFILGSGRRCICGTYGDEAITCADIHADIQGLVGTQLLPARRIRKVLWAIRQECKEPYDDRSEFETWAIAKGISLTQNNRNPDKYAFPVAQRAWEAWQAR